MDKTVTVEELDLLVSEAIKVTGWIGVLAPTSGPMAATSLKALAEADIFIGKLKKLRDR